MRSRITRHLWPVLGEPIPVRPTPRDGAPETAVVDVPPLELNGRDYAIFLLRLAAEIEHGLMVQYLFAAYSLGGPDVPPARQPRVRSWQDTILAVAKEEMAHLITVQNLLMALGGPLQFNREDYPHDNVLYETGFRLQPLSLASLATYVCAESPKGWEGPQADAIKRQAAVHAGGTVNRVGRLYEELTRVIGDRTLVPDGTFDADGEGRQASWDAWSRGFRRAAAGATGTDEPAPRDEHELVIATVTDRVTALAALDLVADQGEGFGDPAEDESHFQRFLEIYEAMVALDDDELAALVRLVAIDPTTHLDGPDVKAVPAQDGDPDREDEPADPPPSPISNPEARLWAHLFNVRYRKLLVSLSHALELDADLGPPGLRGTLINRSFAEMYNLRAIAALLVALPLDHADPGGRRAGPPFQMPYTLMLAQDENDRWRAHRDLLDASATLAGRLATADASGPGQDYLRALAQADRLERAQVDLAIAAAPPRPAGGPRP